MPLQPQGKPRGLGPRRALNIVGRDFLPLQMPFSDPAPNELGKILVIDYVQDHNCINLLTLPMTDDPSNWNASVFVTRAKAEARTVGVLNTPDRTELGESLSLWVQMLEK